MKKEITIGCLMLMLLLAATLQAEVVISQKITVSMMGMDQNMTSVTYLTGDKSRTETEMQGSMAAMMGGGKQVTITRLDKGVVWMLDDKKKSYSEISMAQMAEMMDTKSGEAASGTMGGEADKYVWTTEVEKKGKTEINGITCQGVRATAHGVGKEDPEDKMTLVFEQWLAADIADGGEITAFSEAATANFGFNPMMQNEAMAKMAGQFGFDMQKLEEAMKDIAGIPIRMNMTAAKTMPDNQGGGEQPMFSFTMEVTEIKKATGEIPVYDIPEGYKKGM